MMIRLLSIGKTSSRACAALEDEYAKRLMRFSCERQYVKNEKALIAALTHVAGMMVLLDERGTQMTSKEFAAWIDRRTQEFRDVVFIIGDAEGIPAAIRAQAVDAIALSSLTFPHEIARVLFLEQLYRAQTILAGHPYHK